MILPLVLRFLVLSTANASIGEYYGLIAGGKKENGLAELGGEEVIGGEKTFFDPRYGSAWFGMVREGSAEHEEILIFDF